jgi:small subunit ribosomal protein SAe
MVKISPTANDIKMMVLADTHLSARKCEPGMQTYVYGKAEGGNCLMDLAKTWDKIVLAARILATIEDPSTIYCVGQRPYAQRAIIKFAKEIGATAAPGRFTPGQFTNQITGQFVEPRILLVADPRTDSQAIKESSYVNIPTIAFCGSDSPLEYVDVCIPGNNRGKESLGLVYWMLAREVKRIRGEVVREHHWETKVDLFIYRDPEEVDEKEEQAADERYEADDFEQYDDAAYAPAEFGDPNQQAAAGAAAAGGDFNQDWNQQQPAVGDQEWGAPVGGPQPMHGHAPTDWNDAGTQPQYQQQQPQQQQDYSAPPAQQQQWQQSGYNAVAQQQYSAPPPQQQYSAPEYSSNQNNTLDDWDD